MLETVTPQRIVRATVVAAVLVVLAAVPASAQNLLTNTTFDSGHADWQPNDSRIELRDRGDLGSPLEGGSGPGALEVRVSCWSSSYNGCHQVVDIRPGVTYDVAASVLVPAADNPANLAGMCIRWLAADSTSLGSDNVIRVSPPTDTWMRLEDQLTAHGSVEGAVEAMRLGAFTGAATRRRGRLELADGGTFFLDEVAELKPELQVKLLRAIQERRFERVGGTRTLEVDVGWITATNRDLEPLMAQGRIRADLYHRPAVFPIELPPLREHREDVLPLAEALLARIAGELGRPHLELSPVARDQIVAADWPGNVRELANSLERAAILADGPVLTAAHLAARTVPTSRGGAGPRSLAEIEREAVVRALERNGGHRRRAAAELGIGLRTLYDKLKRYGLG